MVDIITDNKLVLCSESDEGSVEISLTVAEVGLNPSDYISMTTFSVDEISRATSTAIGDIQMRGKHDSPLELKWETVAGIKAKAWVASKV